MLVKDKTVMIPPQPPICPNCGTNMDLVEPDEFFETYAYCCSECGMRTKECDSPDEAYATIRKYPLNYKRKEAEWNV